MVEYLLVQCFSCTMFQVSQKKKKKDFQCKICNEKQSIRKVYGVSFMAKDLTTLVKKYNMEKKSNPPKPIKHNEFEDDDEDENDDEDNSYQDDINNHENGYQQLQQQLSQPNKWSAFLDDKDNEKNENTDEIDDFYGVGEDLDDSFVTTSELGKKRRFNNRKSNSVGGGGSGVDSNGKPIANKRFKNSSTTSGNTSNYQNKYTKPSPYQIKTSPSSLQYQTTTTPSASSTSTTTTTAAASFLSPYQNKSPSTFTTSQSNLQQSIAPKQPSLSPYKLKPQPLQQQQQTNTNFNSMVLKQSATIRPSLPTKPSYQNISKTSINSKQPVNNRNTEINPKNNEKYFDLTRKSQINNENEDKLNNNNNNNNNNNRNNNNNQPNNTQFYNKPIINNNSNGWGQFQTDGDSDDSDDSADDFYGISKQQSKNEQFILTDSSYNKYSVYKDDEDE
ncbi:hypothetical protein ACTA71_010684 [Dictyostelium dimigraforme]